MDLLPKALEEQTLEGALAHEVRRFNAAGREKATFTVTGESREVEPSLQTGLLRICQESFTNVQRHAAATNVSVELSFTDEIVAMVVRDDGVGFEPGIQSQDQAATGYGLRGMSERASLLGGRLEVETRPR